MIDSKKTLITLFFAICSVSFLYSQEDELLPKGLTEKEKELISSFEFREPGRTAPPSGSVRAAAEWEEVEYLVVRWTSSFQNILRQIVQVGVNECKVLIVTQNQSSVSSYLSSNGIDLTNISFINAPSNSIWIRDYAANTIYADDVGQRSLVDWIYNRPRPDDDIVPIAYSNATGIPLYATTTGTNDLVNTGGNYMSDGLGNAFSSDLVLEENQAGNPYGVSAKSEADIDNIMYNYMGIENYIKMPALPYDAIHHIDMHMKLLDEETLLISRYPDGVADGPQIEANIDYILNNFQSPFGTPYKIKRIDSPPSTSGAYPDNGGYYRTFSNSIIINKSILVPTYRGSVDAAALAYYEELMPGYNIVGIDVDNSGENLISQVGAIHCITHTIGVSDPLWIVHQPVKEVNAGTSITINSMLKHNSGISSAKVFWREQGTSAFNETTMSLDTGDDWTTDLPIAASMNNIEYYISAEANSGKVITRPLVAPDGFWTTETQTLSAEEWAINNISSPYPNPAVNTVSFNLNNIGESIQVSIHNVLGQKLFENTVLNGDGVITLDLKDNWNGMLVVTFKGDFGLVSKKVIKL